jgi:modification methylase
MTGGSSVWLVGQRPAREQRRHRYLPESSAHPAKMAPALARAAIETYTSPGDVVVDPMCGVGTALVEAAHAGRDGFGIEYEAHWAALAQANIALARHDGAPGAAEVAVGDCRDLRALLPAGMAGQVGLVLTSPPYGASTHGLVRCGPDGVHKHATRYSADRTNLAYGGLAELLGATEKLLRDCGRVLRPGGVVVLSARPWRRGGILVDFPGALVAAGEAAGLELVERKVALLAGLRDGALVPRASFFRLTETRKARAAGNPLHVIAHEDVLVLRARGR